VAIAAALYLFRDSFGKSSSDTAHKLGSGLAADAEEGGSDFVSKLKEQVRARCRMMSVGNRWMARALSDVPDAGTSAAAASLCGRHSGLAADRSFLTEKAHCHLL
jgi:hypothetical protein